MSRSRGARLHDVRVVDQDRAVVDVLESGEHAQARGLAAAGGPDEHQELSVIDLEAQPVDCGTVRLWIDPGGVFEGDGRHRYSVSLCWQLRVIEAHSLHSFVAPASMPVTRAFVARTGTRSARARSR